MNDGEFWKSLLNTWKSEFGATGCDVTLRSLTYGDRDSVTGWRAKTYGETTIQMIIHVSGATASNLPSGSYVRLDALGLTNSSSIKEGDEIKTSLNIYYEVKAVKPRMFKPSYVEFRECDLTRLPLHEG